MGEVRTGKARQCLGSLQLLLSLFCVDCRAVYMTYARHVNYAWWLVCRLHCLPGACRETRAPCFFLFLAKVSLLRNEPQYPTRGGYMLHTAAEGETATEGDRGGEGCWGG